MHSFIVSILISISMFNMNFVYGNTNDELKSYDSYFVGELGSDWQFPSDHLPIGMTIGSFHVALWNTLNKDYLNYIESNSQGLKNSSILLDNLPIDESSSLTLREAYVATIVMEMISKEDFPRSLIALQETHPDLQDHLTEILPANWKLVATPGKKYSQNVFLYDENIFELVSMDVKLYSGTPSKSIFTLTLKEKATDKVFRFIQSHIPGGSSSKEGIEEFSNEIFRQFKPDFTTVLMGDMNQEADKIDEGLQLVAKSKGQEKSPFIHHAIDYATHINTHQFATKIDHFFVNQESLSDLKVSNPEEIIDALGPLLQVLEKHKKDFE